MDEKLEKKMDEIFKNYADSVLDNLHSLVDFICEKPKIFYRKFRKGKKIYKTRKMFCYNPIKDMMIPTTMLATRMLRRRIENEKNIKF